MKALTSFGILGGLAALTMLVAPLTLDAAESAGGVATGEAAPDFTATDTHGNEHSLSDFAGQIVILEWTNKDCPFVRKFYDSGYMQQWQEEYAGMENVVWLTVCSSAPGNQGHLSAEEWNQLIQKQDSHATAVLMDEDGTVGKAYGATNTPHMYIIDGEGVLRYQGAIDSIRSAKSDDIEEATNYVAQAVEAIQAGEEVEETTTQAYGCGVKY